ncbi:hypothetical protein [Thiococcus pfennigii]|nr:hypothetical protein [Thiococcus pfennigii]
MIEKILDMLGSGRGETLEVYRKGRHAGSARAARPRIASRGGRDG